MPCPPHSLNDYLSAIRFAGQRITDNAGHMNGNDLGSYTLVREATLRSLAVMAAAYHAILQHYPDVLDAQASLDRGLAREMRRLSDPSLLDVDLDALAALIQGPLPAWLTAIAQLRPAQTLA